MLVRDWMNRELVTVAADDSMETAALKMKAHDVRLLPVMIKKDVLVGVVSDRDLKRASASDATLLEVHELAYLLTQVKVKDIMTPHPVTVNWDFTVEEAAALMLSRQISGLPVIGPDDKLMGIITQNDVFRLLIALTGVGRRGMQFALEVADHPGALHAVEEAIRAHGGRIISILTSREGAGQGYRKVFVRAQEVKRAELAQLMATLGQAGRLLYLVDHLENRRQVFA
jgi:acetoin utilization protein AcuB